jgi:hypothetical protein
MPLKLTAVGWLPHRIHCVNFPWRGKTTCDRFRSHIQLVTAQMYTDTKLTNPTRHESDTHKGAKRTKSSWKTIDIFLPDRRSSWTRAFRRARTSAMETVQPAPCLFEYTRQPSDCSSGPEVQAEAGDILSECKRHKLLKPGMGALR